MVRRLQLSKRDPEPRVRVPNLSREDTATDPTTASQSGLGRKTELVVVLRFSCLHGFTKEASTSVQEKPGLQPHCTPAAAHV